MRIGGTHSCKPHSSRVLTHAALCNPPHARCTRLQAAFKPFFGTYPAVYEPSKDPWRRPQVGLLQLWIPDAACNGRLCQSLFTRTMVVCGGLQNLLMISPHAVQVRAFMEAFWQKTLSWLSKVRGYTASGWWPALPHCWAPCACVVCGAQCVVGPLGAHRCCCFMTTT